MTPLELIDRTERFLSNSGIMTDESKWDSLYILSLIDTYSRLAIKNDYAQTKKNNQPTNCAVFFSAPPFLILSNEDSGIYIGSEFGACQYRVVKSRGDLANALAHKSTNKSHQMRVLITGTEIEIYGNQMLKEGMIEGVALFPSKLPTFNIKYDQYPINEDLIPAMNQLMYKNEGQYLSLKPVDTKPDGGDTYNTQNL